MLISCKSMDDSQISIYLEKSSSYKAQITRDVWGVPHVYGKTDADAAFGLAYAHAEDDFKNIAENMYLYRAEMGLKDGIDGAIQDGNFYTFVEVDDEELGQLVLDIKETIVELQKISRR